MASHRRTPSLEARRAPDQLVSSSSTNIDWTLTALDLKELQVEFAALFDRMAGAVHQAGLDLDDVELYRYLHCRRRSGSGHQLPASGGGLAANDGAGTLSDREFIVSVDWLNDRQRLLGAIAESLRQSRCGDSVSAEMEWEHVRITAIRVDARKRR